MATTGVGVVALVATTPPGRAGPAGSGDTGSAGAVTMSPLSWFIVWVRALTAPRRTTRSTRIASTRPSRAFG